MSLKKFFKSLKYALRGLHSVAREEQSFRFQVAIGFAVIILVILFPLATWERILMILMVSAVLVLEVINSILERISDALKPRLHPMIRDIKDMMAGAVLLTAMTAGIVAIMVFSSYLF